jgi:hypothetical protein
VELRLELKAELKVELKAEIKSRIKSGTMSEIKRVGKLEALVRYTHNQRAAVINHLSNITQSI